MSWTTGHDVKAQLDRLWERGLLLRSLVTGDALFPKPLQLRAPGTAELADRFDAVRQWMADVAALPHVRIDYREVHHRILGRQQVPHAIWVDTLYDALALIGKRREAERFAGIVASTRVRQPALEPWLARYPLQVLSLADDWSRLLDLVDWLRRHPKPGVYLRQIDLPGVHTKFVERHRGVLAELLDLALPPDAVDHRYTGAARFAARYGFLEKPIRVRFRPLDAGIPFLPGVPLPDVTLDRDSFAQLDLPVRLVIVTENETNFLALPPVPGALALFGSGYGWEHLADARWLGRCALFYWGDIDTHGFVILDGLRSHFPHAASFLMDRPTLMAHEALWGEEPEAVRRDLSRLTPDEQALYDDLCHDRIRPQLRLEQERIGYSCVRSALDALPVYSR